MEELISEYKEELKRTRKLRETAAEHEKKIYSGMITDLEIAIKWMELGHYYGHEKAVYGQYISNAICLEPQHFEFVGMIHIDGSAIADPFQEAEKRIDKEWRRKKRA